MTKQAARALALLGEDERKAVLRYLFVRDAKMSLASHLLKHYVVSKFCGVPWWESKITRNSKTKPVYVDTATGKSPVEFNVTHQAGLVALVDRLLDAMPECGARGEVDLIADFAAAIPIEVIGNLLAVPHEERGPLRDWSLAILGALEPVVTPANAAAKAAAVVREQAAGRRVMDLPSGWRLIGASESKAPSSFVVPRGTSISA